MQNLALAIVVVGGLLIWAYYAPRLLATVRHMREQRLLTAGRPVGLETLAPGDPRTDREFAVMVRRLSLTDVVWTEGMRRLSRAARDRGHWSRVSRQNRPGSFTR